MWSEPQAPRAGRAGVTAAPGLTGLAFLPRYRALLAAHLPPELAPLGPFFGHPGRLRAMAATLARHAPPPGAPALNLGCGPFSSELFVAALQDRPVTAVDYTAGFAPLHPLLRAEGRLAGVDFLRADARALDLPAGGFGLVVMHDLLYEPALEMGPLLAQAAHWLRPGGLLYFDFVNARTERLWRMLGRAKPFRRYDPADARDLVARAGLALVEQGPTHGAAHPLTAAFHGALWRLARTSNAVAMLARKP